MKITIQPANRLVSAAWLSLFLLWGCGETELESLLSETGDSSGGKPVELSISLADSPEYSDESGSTPATRSGKPLVAEWVKVNSFSATRSAEEYEGPAIAAMELFEDTISSAPQTRATMTAGYYFRVIAFQKSGSSYVFQSVADYTANGANAPVLKQGKMTLPPATYRFVAYSFNNNAAMGTLPSTYTWNSTAISIPNLSNDFMTFDSGDKVVTGETFALPVSFTHQLCKLTVKISVTGFSSNTFTNCKGVYIKQGGNSSSWTVGASAIAANTNNTATFSIANNNATTFTRLVPFAGARPITVHFGTLTVGGTATNNTDITSSQNVKLLAGRRYTMTVQFKKRIGNQVPAGDINLTGNGCTAQDKTVLAKLIWSDGNLKSTAQTNIVWTTLTDNGYYYTWRSTYTGNTSYNNIDPCTRVDASKYGTGWRTPKADECRALVRCTDLKMINGGMWFLNNPKGIFFKAAGRTDQFIGSATVAKMDLGVVGNYWTIDSYDATRAWYFNFKEGVADVGVYPTKDYGFSIRCVKGPV